MNLLTLQMEVKGGVEFYDEGPDWAVVEISSELATRIIHLQHIVIQFDLSEVVDDRSWPQYYNTGGAQNLVDDEGKPREEVNTECDRLCVRQSAYYWKCYEKHGEVPFETQFQQIETLKELLRIAKTSLENLPLLINDVSSDKAKALLKQRLGG